jgi:hypothetical protein
MGDSLHGRAEEIRAIHEELDDLGRRLARHRSNDREQNLRAETMAAVEDRESHGSSPVQGSVECCKRGVVLPRGLTDRRTNHDLKDLVFAKARRPHRGNVIIGNLVGAPGDLVGQCARRSGRPCIVEGGAALHA